VKKGISVNIQERSGLAPVPAGLIEYAYYIIPLKGLTGLFIVVDIIGGRLFRDTLTCYLDRYIAIAYLGAVLCKDDQTFDKVLKLPDIFRLLLLFLQSLSKK